MSRTNAFAVRLVSVCKQIGGLCAAFPLAVPAVAAAAFSAVLSVSLPRRLEPIVNELSLAVARRIAGTGISDITATKSSAVSLLTDTATAMALFLAAVLFALHCARKTRDRLQNAVRSKRARFVSEGFQPPESWEQDVKRDIACVSDAVAAVPEWILLLAGIVVCVEPLPELPLLPALLVLLAAFAVCAVRDCFRMLHISRAAQATAIAAIWAAGVLAVVVMLLQQTDPVIPLGTVVRSALAMTLAVPTALLLPYRSAGAILDAAQRLRRFLK